jgi:ABC-type transport system involved in multi-copper enzyme maturation permease subunit
MVNNKLNEIRATRFSRGLNLFCSEQKTWWKTRRWWFQTLLWSLVMGGITGLILFVFPGLRGDGGDVLIQTSPVTEALGFVFGSMAPLLAGAVMVLFQGSLVQERKNGVAPWILSKPVDRDSYILAKFFSGTVIVAVVILFIPLSLTLILFQFSGEELFALSPYAGASALLFLFLIFHLALILFFGTLMNSEGAVGGTGIFLMLAFTVAIELVPALRPLFPWSLPGAALTVVNGLRLPDWWVSSLGVTLILTIILLVLAIARFRREDIRG